MSGSHPFSLVMPLKDAPDMAASLVAQGVTADPTGAVQLISGNVECISCHNAHVQGIDRWRKNSWSAIVPTDKCAWRATIPIAS